MKNHTLKPAHFSCPFIAAHFIGLNYGAEKFADETYQSRAVVYNKLNPDNDSNHLSLRDAIALTEKANNNAILEAWAHQRGGVFVHLPEVVCCDEELTDQVLKTSETLGELMAEIRAARKDGVIDPAEFERIKQQAMSCVAVIFETKAAVKSQVRELPVAVSK